MNNKPNIIVIMADQFKATASHLYGNTVCKTPFMERLAKEGVLYKNAFTPHPLCVPARISLWTSQYPHTHGGRRNETLMPENTSHIFEIWKNEGYTTGLIGKNHCFKCDKDMELFDVWCEITHTGLVEGSQNKGMDWILPIEDINKAHSIRSNMPWQSSKISYAVTDFPLDHYSTGLVTNQTVQFLENNSDKPFALWVSYPDPHTPQEVPKCYADLFPKEKIELPLWKDDEYSNAPQRNKVMHQMAGVENESREDLLNLISAYYGMARFVDDGLGKIMDTLNDLGLRENTIVVFCSDHGDFLGEHGVIYKAGLFYDCLTKVPLIVSWPGHISEGCTDDSMVNLIDIAPTLLELQKMNIPEYMQGKGLPIITKEEPRDEVFAEYGAGGSPFTLFDLDRMKPNTGRTPFMDSLMWREAEGRRKMVRTKEWKYVHDPMGDKDELYNLVNDPWELNNVIDDKENTEILMNLRLRLLDWSISTEDARPVPLP